MKPSGLLQLSLGAMAAVMIALCVYNAFGPKSTVIGTLAGLVLGGLLVSLWQVRRWSGYL
jgi:hypothetical protein